MSKLSTVWMYSLMKDTERAAVNISVNVPDAGMHIEGGVRTKGILKHNSSDQPLVSVITAVFNDAPSLEKSIRSVIDQTYDNVEYLIIDGGSDDAFLKVVEKYADSVDYWISEQDKGIYDAWNKGVKLARGEWIAFLGAGDTYEPTAIATYIDTIAAQEKPADFISSRTNLVSNDNRPLRLKGRPFIWSEVRKAMNFIHVGAFHHRSLFERFGLFDQSYRSAGDYEFFMRCGEKIRAAFTDTVTVNVLVGGISLHSSLGLRETLAIQKKYGVHPLYAHYKYWLVRLKQKVRPYIRGY